MHFSGLAYVTVHVKSPTLDDHNFSCPNYDSCVLGLYGNPFESRIHPYIT